MTKKVFLAIVMLLCGVMTQAQVTTFPYTQGFENGLDGWTVIDSDGDGYNWEVTSGTPTGSIPSHSGSAMITSRSYTSFPLTPDNWLVSPAIVLDDTARQLSWWHHTQDPSYPAEHYAVYISTTGNTVADFTGEPVYETTLSAADNEYNIHQVMLSEYEGETIYVAFRHFNCTDMFYFHIDDIVIEAAAGCQPPTGLTFENITSTSADMTFDMPTSATNGVRFLVNGVEQPVLTSGSYSFTDLEPGTVYTIHLYSLCGDGDTSFATTAQFMTECVNITLPYVFDFEDDHANCYNYEHMYWRTDPNYSHSGEIGFYSASCAGHYVVTPVIEAPEDESLNAIFEFYALPLNAAVDFKLYVSTEASLSFDSTFTVVMDTTLAAATSATFQSIKLSLVPYAGQNITIALEHTSTSSSAYMFIDDITVRSSLAPVASIPSTATANINTPLNLAAILQEGDPTSVTYAWTSVMEAAGNATMTATDSLLTITYTAQGIDTITMTATNAHGSSVSTMVVRVRDLNPVTVYPYTCGFEPGQDSNWQIENSANGWYIDTAVHQAGSYALYISADSGATHSYDNNTASVSNAYRTFNIAEPGDYAISFDWMGNGESSYDYLRAYFTSASTEFSTTSIVVPTDAQLLDGGRLNQSTSWQTVQQIVTFTTPGLYFLTFIWRNDGSLGTNPPAAIDNVSIAQLSCSQPQGLTMDYVGTDTLTFHWTAGGEEESWVITVSNDTAVVINNAVATETSYVAENLTPGTRYTISVRALCGEGDTSFSADTMLATLRVLNPVTTLPYSTGFETGDDVAWFFDNGANGWYIDTAAHHTGSAALYISADSGATYSYTTSGATSNSYATRAFTLPAGEYSISFDWQANGEGTTYHYDYLRAFIVPANITFEANVLYSGLSYSTTPAAFIALDGGHQLNNSSTWQTQEAVFNIETAGIYNLVFFWRNDGSTGTQPPAAIDNIVLSALTCPSPAGFALDTVNADTIAFHWTARGEEENWVVTVSNDSAVVANVIVNDTFYMVEGLEPNTPYTIQIRALCGEGDTSFSYTNVVRTECGLITLPYFESFENGGEACWTAGSTSSSGAASIYSYESSDGAKSLRLYMNANGVKTYAIMPYVGELSTLMVTFKNFDYYDENNLLEVGTVPSQQSINGFVPLFSTIGTDDWAEQEVRFAGDTSGNHYIAFRATGATSATFVLIDEVTVMVAPGCARPEGISVSNVEATSANLHIDDTTGVNNYRVVVISGTDTVIDAMALDTAYTLSGLDANTNYTVIVNAVCDDGTSTSSRTASFRTACTGGSCEFTVSLADSYGDGWNGNAINVWQNGSIYESVTLASGSSDMVTLRPCLGDPVALIWVSGSYAYETSFTITDASNTVLLSAAGDDYTAGDTILIFDGACNATIPGGGDTSQIDTTIVCDAPAIVAATATNNSVMMTFTSPASNFEVAIVQGAWQAPANGTAITAHNYTFTGLEAATQYTVGVRAVCDEETYSTWTTRSITTTNNNDTNSIASAEGLAFRLSPNPASAMVTVDVDGNASVAVLDLNGREVLRTEEKTFDVSNLAKGAYFVRITTQDGTAVRKLIVR